MKKLSSATTFVEGGVYGACDHAGNISLEAFCDSDSSTVTSCKHDLHLQCILEWMDKGVIVCICDSRGVPDIYEVDGASTIAASEPLVCPGFLVLNYTRRRRRLRGAWRRRPRRPGTWPPATKSPSSSIFARYRWRSTCERLPPGGEQYTSSCIPQEEVHTDDVIIIFRWRSLYRFWCCSCCGFVIQDTGRQVADPCALPLLRSRWGNDLAESTKECELVLLVPRWMSWCLMHGHDGGPTPGSTSLSGYASSSPIPKFNLYLGTHPPR